MKILKGLALVLTGLLMFASAAQAGGFLSLLTLKAQCDNQLIAVVNTPGWILANQQDHLPLLERLQTAGANQDRTDGLYGIDMGSLAFGRVSVRQVMDASGAETGRQTCIEWTRVTLKDGRSLPISGDQQCLDGQFEIRNGYSTIIKNPKVLQQK